MCGLGCGGGGGNKSASSKSSGYTPKIKSAGKASKPLPSGWATGGSRNNSFGTPKVRATFGGRK